MNVDVIKNCTVKDLIDRLKQCEPDDTVWVQGYHQESYDKVGFEPYNGGVYIMGER